MKTATFSRMIKRLVFPGLVIGLALGGIIPSQTAAQSGEDTWILPVNLSQSGLTTSPALVVDHSGTSYVFWLDLLEGVVYARGDGEQWEAPTAVDPPFETDFSDEGETQGGGGLGRGSGDTAAAGNEIAEAAYGMFVPLLIADQGGKIHAFWINTENELFYSSVVADDLANNSWSTAVSLAETVQGFDLFIDSFDRLHLAYVLSFNNSEYSAGVFYRSRDVSRGDWSMPASLYSSPYFRAITQEEANVDIFAVEEDDSQLVYVAWDNRPRDKLYFTQSRDGGRTWGMFTEVQEPGSGLQPITPYDVRIAANEEDVILFWKEVESEVNCRQYFQISRDRGETWGPRQPLLENLPGCPESNNFMTRDDGLILLEQTRLNQLYLLAWNGIEWSNPQLQQAIDNFVDPETLKPLELQCRNTAIAEGNVLVLAGCDSSASKDIWLTSRGLDSVSHWFPLPSEWRQPITVATGLTDLSPLSMVSDDQGRLHAVWSRRGADLTSGEAENAISYARWDEDHWILSPDVLVPPSGGVREMDIAIDSKERLIVVWSGGQSGEIYYSWANSGLANSISEWASPKALPSIQNLGRAPEILIDELGTMYVVSSIPLNEGRGIYLTKSKDSGATWSEPIRIFDGVAAGWEMVNHPHLARTSDGSLHVVWTRYRLSDESAPIALYYSRSPDGGETWTEPEVVVEAPILWSQIQGVGESTVHRIWQEINNDLTVIRFEISLDGGLSWSQLTNISGLGTHKGSAALIEDNIGQLHVLHLSEEASENLILRQWSWDGASLAVGQSLDLGSGRLGDGVVIAADMTPAGYLAVIISKEVADPLNGLSSDELIFSGRTMELPADVPIRLPQATPHITPTLEPTPEIEASPSPTLSPTAARVQVENQPESLADDTKTNLVPFVATASAGFLVLLAIYVGVRSKLKN